ncbi:MAG: hypothetical protein AB7O66_12035 [Limisphaerales bacterium]
MGQYDHLIDPTDFGTVTRYLKAPSSEIWLVFHVRERQMISKLAEELQRESAQTGARPGKFPLCVEQGIESGWLKVSARNSHATVPNQKEEWFVRAEDVEPRTTTWVLYFPPAYIAHTPGLFEGQVMRSQRKQQVEAQAKVGSGNPPSSSTPSQGGQGAGTTTSNSQSQSQGQSQGR